jgi:hypothetical protein
VLRVFEHDWIAADFPETGHDERLRALIEAAPTEAS